MVILAVVVVLAFIGLLLYLFSSVPKHNRNERQAGAVISAVA